LSVKLDKLLKISQKTERKQKNSEKILSRGRACLLGMINDLLAY